MKSPITIDAIYGHLNNYPANTVPTGTQERSGRVVTPSLRQPNDFGIVLTVHPLREHPQTAARAQKGRGHCRMKPHRLAALRSDNLGPFWHRMLDRPAQRLAPSPVVEPGAEQPPTSLLPVRPSAEGWRAKFRGNSLWKTKKSERTAHDSND